MSAAEYIEGNVERITETGCWIWMASKHNKHGYGSAWYDGKRVLAHRLHRCDVPACCNPAHLFVGTQIDNIRDAIAKKRHKPCTARAKLSDQQREEAVRLRAAGWSLKKVGDHFGISNQSVHYLVSKWRKH